MATNFDCITQSPERLAEFIDDVTVCCGAGGDSYCNVCPLKSVCEYEITISRWLQEECDE